MKEFWCTVCGVIGSTISYFFGGWDDALICLSIFMLIDLATGVIVAVVFHKSPKNASGKLESKQFLRGIFKKIGMFLLVGVTHLLDNVLGVSFLKTACVFAFIANELISITENLGLMGVPLPKAITIALELLTNKEEQANGSTN